MVVPSSNGSSVIERLPTCSPASANVRGGPLTSAAERRSGELRHQLIAELQRNTHISQRVLSRRLGVGVGTVNRLLGDLMESGYVEVFNRSIRPFAYRVTSDGERFERRLSREVFSTALANVRRLEERIRATLAGLQSRGARRLVCYGAGAVMEITSRLAVEMGLAVLGIVDDDAAKHGSRRSGIMVHPPEAITELRPDAVLITTLRHAEAIRKRLRRLVSSSLDVQEL